MSTAEPGAGAAPVNDRRVGRFRSDSARRAYMDTYDRALAGWPVPVTQLDVDTRYGSTHVARCGTHAGTPIVLLHAIAVSSPSWFADVGALAASHPVYAVDTITDVGRSTQTAAVRDGVDFSAWLDDVLAALELERVHVVGLSYGGWLALNQACRAPRRLASVTAVDPPGAIGHGDRSYVLKVLPDALLAKFAKSDAALHRLLRALNNGTPLTQPLLDLSVAGLRSFVAKAPLPKRMSDAALREISVPVLLLFCERSPVNLAGSAARRSRELIANATVEVVPGAGHMLPIEDPAGFTSRVLDFVGNVDA